MGESESIESDEPLESQDTVTAFADLSVATIQNDAPSEETEEVPASEISPPKSKNAVIRLKRKQTTIELKVSFALRLGSEQTKVSYAQVCHKRVVARKRTAMRNKQKRTASMWLRANQRLVAPTTREPREFVRFGRRVAPHRATPGAIRKTKRLRVKGGFGSTQKRFGKASSRLAMWR